MMKKVILFMFIGLLLSCGPSQDEINYLKAELALCEAENAKLKNTPTIRLTKSQTLYSSGSLLPAKMELESLVEDFPESVEAKTAKELIGKIQFELNKEKKELEIIQREGFKILEPSTRFELGDLTYNFHSLKETKRWVTDRYESRYHYRDAERGEKYLVANLSISSESKDPSLHPIVAFYMKGGSLYPIGKFKYEFYRWKDYGSYLGNYSDYGNDFAHSKTVKFSPGIAISEEIMNNYPIYVFVSKSPCFFRSENTFSTPEVKYKDLNCETLTSPSPTEANGSFQLVRIIK